MRHLPEKSGLEGESTTLIKTYYGEGLFDNKQGVMFTENIEAEIRTILIENHGVGIMGGFYSEGLPICMFSELMVEMLGYDSAEEMKQNTRSKLLKMISPYQRKYFLEKVFAEKTRAGNMHMFTKNGDKLWV